MKLIKRGVDPTTAIRSVTCDNCKSEYDYTNADSDINIEYQLFNIPSYRWFKCEVCSERIICIA